MGAFLLNAGAKGKRFSLPNSRVMIHQPLGGYSGQASDIDIHAKEMAFVKERLNRIMASHCNRTYKQVVKDTDRDNFLSPSEALEYGIIDQILVKR
jgi:ATP-dependent Clp protease protease subunit